MTCCSTTRITRAQGSDRGLLVPEVLLAGDHARVERWRRREALRQTKARRPELLSRIHLDEQDERLMAEPETERQEVAG